jgi:hypothetical protein
LVKQKLAYERTIALKEKEKADVENTLQELKKTCAVTFIDNSRSRKRMKLN